MNEAVTPSRVILPPLLFWQRCLLAMAAGAVSVRHPHVGIAALLLGLAVAAALDFSDRAWRRPCAAVMGCFRSLQDNRHSGLCTRHA
jgi:hypothetical protein